jgi:hypothetical protein
MAGASFCVGTKRSGVWSFKETFRGEGAEASVSDVRRIATFPAGRPAGPFFFAATFLDFTFAITILLAGRVCSSSP